jgi:hypothetical protein
MKKMTPEQRSEVARRAVEVRWGKRIAPAMMPEQELDPHIEGLSQQQREALGKFDSAVKELQQWDRLREQLRVLDYKKWQPRIAGSIPKRSYGQITSDAKVGFRYLPSWVSGLDSRSVLQYAFLDTCKELGIPEAKWPKFEPPVPNPIQHTVELPPFIPPPFDVLRDTAKTWREKADCAWAEYCKVCLAKIRAAIDSLIPTALKAQVQRRQGGRSSPMEMRLEWAARYYCLGLSYGKLHLNYNPKNSSPAAVIMGTKRLLHDLGLPPRTAKRPH